MRTKNWVEINHESPGKYDNNSIKFKTSKIKSALWDYNDAYIFVSGTITITEERDNDATKE